MFHRVLKNRGKEMTLAAGVQTQTPTTGGPGDIDLMDEDSNDLGILPEEFDENRGRYLSLLLAEAGVHSTH